MLFIGRVENYAIHAPEILVLLLLRRSHGDYCVAVAAHDMNHLTTETALRFESMLPTHKCELCITHNQHKVYYEMIADYVLELKGDWESEDAKSRAITADEIWEMQWYPETPVGFKRIFAPTLAELISFSQKS